MWAIAVGILLIAIGIFFVLPRGTFPGRTSNVDLTGGHAYPINRKTNDNDSPRGKFEGVRVGLGLIALGALCVAVGALT
jgi:hypothetical protein